VVESGHALTVIKYHALPGNKISCPACTKNILNSIKTRMGTVPCETIPIPLFSGRSCQAMPGYGYFSRFILAISCDVGWRGTRMHSFAGVPVWECMIP